MRGVFVVLAHQACPLVVLGRNDVGGPVGDDVSLADPDAALTVLLYLADGVGDQEEVAGAL